MTPDDLRFAVLAGDVKAISAAPGIGKKTAEKLIIELKDKLNIDDVLTKEEEVMSVPSGGADMQSEAVQALVALGYGSAESLKAVKKVPMTKTMTVEELLKQSLKFMVF